MRTFTDDNDIVHSTYTRSGSFSSCGIQRTWRENPSNGIWLNKRFKFDKPMKTPTCLRCIRRPRA